MRFDKLLVTLSSAGGITALSSRYAVPPSSSNSTIPEPKRYIIEFEPGTDYADLKSKIASKHGTTILKTFDSDIFAGISVESTDDNVDSLLAIGSVAQVWPSKKIKLDTVLPTRYFNYSGDATATPYSTHSQTGVDKLHAAGICGKGAVVAIVDTGVQYTHPALGGGFGPGYKIVGGYDFVGDGCWPYVGCEKVPDDDPMDQIGHGTHVAGIVAGKSGLFTGVAPEATLLSYKVFTDYDGTDDETLIDAFLAAYDAGADVITCSVAGPGGFIDDAWGQVASRIVDAGVVITIANGNYGTEGPFFASIGSSGQHVLGVASVEATVVAEPAFLATFNLDGQSNTTTIGYFDAYNPIPWTVDQWPVVPITLNTSVENDACEPLPEGEYNFTNKVVLARLGGCDGRTKQTNIQNAGGHYTLFYFDDTSTDMPSVSRVGGFVGMIEARTGEAMVKTIMAGGSIITDFATLSDETYFVGMPNYPNYGGGFANYFTSWGGLYDLTIKPDVAAPGGDILSTWPTDSWAVASGTSMATPYVAGVAALYIGQYGGRKTNPDFNSTELVMKIISSGDSIPWNDGQTMTDYGMWAPVPQVGTGMINGFKILNYTTSLSYTKFELNDTHHFSRYHPVQITNKNPSASVTYSFAVEDAAGFEIWLPDATSPRPKDLFELEPIKIVPTVTLPKTTTLAPGQSKTVQFNFMYPVSSENIPLYSGKIIITSSLGEELAIPYMGLASNLEEDMKGQFQDGYPYIVSGLDNVDISQESSFTFNLSPDSQDFPKLFSRQQWGSRELRWDIFDANWVERDWTYPPVVGENGYVGTATYWEFSGEVAIYDPSLYPNTTNTFPILDVPRCSIDVASLEYWWFGQLGDGSQIAPGDYIMRFASSVPFGDLAHSDNWDTYTKTFSVLPL